MAMTRAIVTRLGLAAVLCLGVGPGAGATEETLRWKLKTGETLHYEFRQTCGIKVNGADGRGTHDTSELTIDLTWKVRGVAPDGTAAIALVVERVRSEARTGAQKVHYDSAEEAGADPAARPLKDVYGAAVGAEYSLKIDTRGRVVAAEVPAKVSEALRASPFQATADGGSALSGPGLKNLFAQLFPVLPEGPVGKGAAWSSALEVPAPPMRITLTYRDELAALHDAAARIDARIETVIRPEPDAALKVHVRSQSGNRSVTIDTRNGRVTASAVQQSIELKLVILNREVGQVITLDERLRLIP